ncbi:AsmA-like C-terminal region-containing protein [Roseobacter litoralis]|uniref:YhdP family protein n=1 Tax=Roseobacter litoralis TaxID=42443 RepID=UPI0024903898|nr:AsmA-like C-terminal region-containing protein [Roseobacter litoralis]
MWTGVIFALLLVGASFSAVWLQGRELLAPPWLRDRIQAQLGQAIPDVEVAFGDVVVVVDEDWRPRFSVRDVHLANAQGDEIVGFSDVSGGLSIPALLDWRFSLGNLQVNGVFVTLRRSPEGALSLSTSADTRVVSQQAPTLVQLVTELDELLLRPVLRDLSLFEMRAITLRYEDARADRAWTVDGGMMQLRRNADALEINVDLAVLGGGADVATLAADYAGTIGAAAASFGLSLENIDAGDVASQGAAVSWLGVLDAPISATLRGTTRDDGGLDPLNVALQIGAGVIQPTPEAQPIPIDGASSYFTYLPQEQTLRFDAFAIDSKWGQGSLEGQAVLESVENGRIGSLVGQFRLSELRVNPAGLYDAPVQIEATELDFRLKLAPFSLTLGRLDVRDQGNNLSARGELTAGQQGWNVSVDANLDALSSERLLALWPEALVPKTRNWISENIKAGHISDAAASLRITQGGAPETYLGFDFHDADFTFIKEMPPISGGRGHASLFKNRFAIAIDEGAVTAPQGGRVEVAGSSFIVPDVKAKPDPPGVVRLSGQSSVTAALSLLDQPPLQVMQKADVPVDVADGQLDFAGTLSLPLKKGTKVDDVTFDVTGNVMQAHSDTLLKDRTLAAATLALTASETEIEVAGSGTIDDVPLDIVWTQAIGAPDQPTPGRVTGRVQIDRAALEAFGIALPEDMVRGRGEADIALDLLKGTPPQFSLTSDLVGLDMALTPLGWSKRASVTGTLAVDMTLGENAKVDRILLDAPGLYAVGDITLTPQQQLERMRLSEVRLGNWLNAPVDIVGRGADLPPGIVLRGGTVDLRRADLPSGAQPDGNSGPLTVALDRLTVSDTIAITDMRGAFQTSGGLAGNFDGQINGAARVVGKVSPQNGRPSLQLSAENAGRALAASGLVKQVRGGALQLSLVPVGTGGAFDGKLNVQNITVRDAPTMAALLNSISIVGLINQLNGDGIYFSDVSADFRLAPSRITLRQASATGASIGLSMDGVFYPASGQIDMEGVISPVYMLNAIGSVLSRPGEGLFGFNYSITGTAQSPDVFVNPLTALAPGILRNLFRGSRAKAPLEAGEPVPVPEPRRIPVVTRGEDR